MNIRTPRGSKDEKGAETKSGKSGTRSLEAESKAPRLVASRRRTPVSLSGLLWRFAFLPTQGGHCNDGAGAIVCCVCSHWCVSSGVQFHKYRLYFQLCIYFFAWNYYVWFLGVVECLISTTVCGSFSLWEPTCMHCVYLALWTRKGFEWQFLSPYINFHSSIHIRIDDKTDTA